MAEQMPVIPENRIHLVLFLSRATPLARWVQMGIFEREIAIYRRLAQRFNQLSIVTSGGKQEVMVGRELAGIEILHNRWGISPNLYSVLAPMLHATSLRSATIFKTNQLDGAWTAILAGKLHRKPVVARAGYLWAEDNRSEGAQGLKATVIDRLQGWTLRRADGIFLTTPAMKAHVVERYGVAAETITVMPNYVDTARFHPMPEVAKVPGRICYVGRLHPRKNLDLLIRAVAAIPGASLQLIGQGPHQAALATLAGELGADVTFAGVIPHNQIPAAVNAAEIFILPSDFEGHPKALLEAMACGAAVIGTDVPGTREEIRHGETGLLCRPVEESIRDALQQLLTDPLLRRQLGDKAHKAIVAQYSLDHLVDWEINALQGVIGYTREKGGKA